MAFLGRYAYLSIGTKVYIYDISSNPPTMKNYFEGLGKMIAVDVAEPYNQVSHYHYPLELTWWTILRQKIFSRSEKIIVPSIINTFMEGFLLCSNQKTKMNAALANIYIKPNLAGYPMWDLSMADEMIEIGYASAQKHLANWRVDLNFLEKF